MKNEFLFDSANHNYYRVKNNCGFIRPYIVDFSKLADAYNLIEFKKIINDSRKDPIKFPPTLLIQIGLGYIDGKFDQINSIQGIDILIELLEVIFSQSIQKDNSIYVLHKKRKKEYGLNAGWSSAMTQGQLVSLLLRLDYSFPGILEKYTNKSAFLINGMLTEIANGGTCFTKENELWLEEYPVSPAPHVLNGALFSLFALIEYNLSNRAINNEGLKSIEEKFIMTLNSNIQKFNIFGWSKYDLGKSNFAPPLYHYIHIIMLSYLGLYLENKKFQYFSAKWMKSYLNYNTKIILIFRVIFSIKRKILNLLLKRPY